MDRLIKWINSRTGAQYCSSGYSLWDLIAYGSSKCACMFTCVWLPVRLSCEAFDWYFLRNRLFALCLFSIKDSFSQAMTSADNDVTANVCLLLYMNDNFFILNPCVFRSQNEIDGNIGSNPSSGCLSSDSCSFSKISQSSTEDLSGNLFNLFQKTVFCW